MVLCVVVRCLLSLAVACCLFVCICGDVVVVINDACYCVRVVVVVVVVNVVVVRCCLLVDDCLPVCL